MSNITIAGIEFEIDAPYAAGHTLTENEAAALNQVRAENIGNNFRSKVAKLKDEKGDEADFGPIQAELTEYAKSYAFGVRRASARVPADPVQAEAYRMARDDIAKALKAKGLKFADYPAEKIEEAIKRQLDAKPEYLEVARRTVEARNAAGAASLDDLLGEPIPRAEPAEGETAAPAKGKRGKSQPVAEAAE